MRKSKSSPRRTNVRAASRRTVKPILNRGHLTVGLAALLLLFIAGSAFALPRSSGNGNSSAAGKCVVNTDSVIGWWRGQQNTKGSVGPDLVGDVEYEKAMSSFGFKLADYKYLETTELPTISTAVTAQAWIKPEPDNGFSQFIMSRWKTISLEGPNSYGFILSGGGRISWITDDTSTRVPIWLTATVPELYDGNFHHIVGTWEVGKNINLYVDGKLVATERAFGFALNAAAETPFRIGRISGPGVPFAFNGVIDEPAVFNRALSADEVSAIYKAGEKGKCHEDKGQGNDKKDKPAVPASLSTEQKQQAAQTEIAAVSQSVATRQVVVNTEVCLRNQQKLSAAVPRLATSANAVKASIDTMYSRVDDYYETEQPSVANYEQLKLQVDAAKLKAEGDTSAIEHYKFDLDCSNPSVGTQLDGYRTAVAGARGSLKDYRDSLVQLVTNLKGGSAE